MSDKDRANGHSVQFDGSSQDEDIYDDLLSRFAVAVVLTFGAAAAGILMSAIVG